MDFIERWFGISPDGGTGAVEAGLAAALAGAVLAIRLRHMLARSFLRFAGWLGNGQGSPVE